MLVKGKGDGTSYANFLSNPAIHEYMNKRNKAEERQVSQYIEGPGTEEFSDEAQANGIADELNGRDDLFGNGFGAGPTSIRIKVDRGISRLQEKIPQALSEKEQYIQKIQVDVFGFSRGAAAARYFISRRDFLYGPWQGQPTGQARPEVVINFVGLYDTVSSFAPKLTSYWRLLRGVIHYRSLNTDHFSATTCRS